MTTILLARHGETDWNAKGRLQGHFDTPLNERGREQARALADRLEREPLRAVYSSDLARARDTARIVAERKRLDVSLVPDLRERHFGSWEGLTDDEIRLRFPEAQHAPWGDGESREEMSHRVVAALLRIVRDHPAGPVLVVTHGGPIRAVQAWAAGISYADARRAGPALVNCGLVRLEIEDGVARAADCVPGEDGRGSARTQSLRPLRAANPGRERQ